MTGKTYGTGKPDCKLFCQDFSFRITYIVTSEKHVNQANSKLAVFAESC